MQRTTPFSFAVAAAAALTASIALPAAAQEQSQARRPSQTQDAGRADEAPAQTPPGQVKKQGERNTAAVPVTYHANGMVSAQLDESFEEALVVTRQADGTFALTCMHGLPLASQHAAKGTSRAGASRKTPAAVRTLEVK